MKMNLVIAVALLMPANAEDKPIDIKIGAGDFEEQVRQRKDYSDLDFYYSQENRPLVEPEFTYNDDGDPTMGNDELQSNKEYKLKLNLGL